MTKLITGGTGYVGSELARLLVEQGEKVVLFDIMINRFRIADIAGECTIIQGDLSNYSRVLNAVKENDVTEIYHLGSMLTNASDLSPWDSFQTNVIGTYNVLEAARIFNVEKMMFTSTFGTFGLLLDEVLTDVSVQRPITFYGCGKLYCEGLGRYYNRKFGLDFRSVRYAQMVGPGVRTQGHWAPAMIEDAINGKKNECIYAYPETAISMIYVKDAARAADMVLRAPRQDIRMMNYNVAGIPDFVTAAELETALENRYENAKVVYKPDESLQEIGNDFRTLKKFDDGYARNEWGWYPEYDTIDRIIDAFEMDIKTNPERYGI
ncbi:MAG: NAD-dependent epimerase/dehydratase family protein [Dehalococcoidales bacterium]|nr:MAG: NAD-dependent epimerase/dehydratase family protein [Dehalococcoidales bacterium]